MDSVTNIKPKPMFGEEMIWLFIFGDMCTFTLFFFYFAHLRVENLPLFQASQSVLNVHYGSMNTLLLLTSSWFVVIAAMAARRAKTQRTETQKAVKALSIAFILGTVFAVLKLIEYKAKFDAGITFETNHFYTFYYLLTGLHLTHVLIGISLLVYFAYSFKTQGISELGYANFTSVAIFWHMVDLLWIIIFPLLYLLPQDPDMMEYMKSKETIVWFILTAITGVSWVLGANHAWFSSQYEVGIISLIVLAFFKIRLVMYYFMEVRKGPLALKLSTDGWILFSGLGLIAIFLGAFR